MADYAVLCAGAWSVPIYPTLPASQIAPLLKDCAARAIFVSSLEQLGKILTIKAQCPSLDHVILIDGSPPGEPGYMTFLAVVERGRPALEMNPAVFDQRAQTHASRPVVLPQDRRQTPLAGDQGQLSDRRGDGLEGVGHGSFLSAWISPTCSSSRR